MITVIAHHTAAVDAARQLLARHAATSRDEPGCLQFDAHQGIDNQTSSRSWNCMTTRYALPNTPGDSTTAKGGNCRCTD
jgi:hypothetical protein